MGRLYQGDFYGWTQDQADALRRRSVNEIDWDNLLEEVIGLGASERGELRSRLAVLFCHILKWRYQPTGRSRSWVLTIREQRQQVARILKDNPSLRPLIPETLEQAYGSALNRAADETCLPDDTFPAEPPFDFDTAMSERIEWEQD